MIKVEQVTAYRVGDKTFKTEKEADDHLLRLNLFDWAERVGLCRGGEWSQDMVVNTILEHIDEIKRIINESK